MKKEKETRLQRFFLKKSFKFVFFVFLFWLVCDVYRAVFCGIDCLFYEFGIDSYKGVYSDENSSFFFAFFYLIFYDFSLKIYDPTIDPWGFVAGAFVIIFVMPVMLLLLFSTTIIVYSQIKNFVLKGENFNILFYFLSFLFFYSIGLYIATNANLTAFGHVFLLSNFSIEKMTYSITFAIIIMLVFKKYKFAQKG